MEIKKLFYSMGEVSEMFDVNPSLIRYWESQFDALRPKKNKKGNRLFRPEDVETLKVIYHLVKERGMTLEGAKKALKQNKGEISRDSELLERLQRVRSLLEEVREELKAGEEDLLVEEQGVAPKRRAVEVKSEAEPKEESSAERPSRRPGDGSSHRKPRRRD
jgi:DNA-binding transcriptional MerR regulator